MNRRLYVVTGAMGHLGNTIVHQLLENGCQVRGLALPSDRSVLYQHPNMEVIYGDVRDKKSMQPLFAHDEGQELVVIHTAGIVSITSKYRQNVYDVNVTGTRNVVELCWKYGVKKLVYDSSVHAIPEPKSGIITEVTHFNPEDVVGLYAKTKAEASQIVLDSASHGLDASIVHPSGIIGPGDYGHAHLTQMILDYLDGRLIACVPGGYDFVDVRDVADGTISCVDHGKKGECYILSNCFFSIPDLLRLLHKLTGRKEIRTVLPIWFAKATAPLSEIYYKIRKQPPLYTSYSLYTLESNANFSHSKAERELSYHPRPLVETLADTVAWLKENHRLKTMRPSHRILSAES